MPEEFNGQRSLAGYGPWGHKELDMTERLTLSLEKLMKIQVVMVRKSLSQVLVVGHCEEARGAQQQGG